MLLSKVKVVLKAENSAVFKAVVNETLKTKRQEETDAAIQAASLAAREEAAAARPAGLLGRLFV